jgi:preprotein translocase subunit YajC
MIFMLAPMVLVVIFMLFTSRSQRKRDEAVRAKLKKGDKVVSQSGLIGELVELDDKVAKVKIAPGTNVQMLVGSISPYDASAAPQATEKDLKDLKDAKAAAEKKG